jgi:hypothetical protein
MDSAACRSKGRTERRRDVTEVERPVTGRDAVDLLQCDDDGLVYPSGDGRG